MLDGVSGRVLGLFGLLFDKDTPRSVLLACIIVN